MHQVQLRRLSTQLLCPASFDADVDVLEVDRSRVVVVQTDVEGTESGADLVSACHGASRKQVFQMERFDLVRFGLFRSVPQILGDIFKAFIRSRVKSATFTTSCLWLTAYTSHIKMLFKLKENSRSLIYNAVSMIKNGSGVRIKPTTFRLRVSVAWHSIASIGVHRKSEA